MKKIALVFAFGLVATAVSVQAVGVSDIPAIVTGARNILEHAYRLNSFAGRIKILADNNFAFTLPDSTQTVTLSNQERLQLIGQYNALLKNLETELAAMPR